MFKVGIVILNYNGKNILQHCLESIRKVTYCNYEIILVDNGSSDGSIEMIKKNFPSTIIIEMNYNTGFSRANNFGINLALYEKKCDGVLLLNNDTEVDQYFLDGIEKICNAEYKVGMVAFRVLYFNNRNIINATGQVITPDGLAKSQDEGGLSENNNFVKETFAPYGAAAFFSKELLEDIKYDNQFLDEDFFLYFEELDLGWRARLRGWKCLYKPDSIVYHHKSATAGKYSELVAFYTNRNIFYNTIKNYPGHYIYKALFLSLLKYPMLSVYYLFGRGSGTKFKENIRMLSLIKVIWRGWVDVFRNLRKLIKKRKYIQNRIIVDKKEIDRWFRELGISFFRSLLS